MEILVENNVLNYQGVTLSLERSLSEGKSAEYILNALLCCVLKHNTVRNCSTDSLSTSERTYLSVASSYFYSNNLWGIGQEVIGNLIDVLKPIGVLKSEEISTLVGVIIDYFEIMGLPIKNVLDE